MLMTIITSLLKALAAYLELKNKSFYYDILEKSRNRQNQLREEIENLRNEGDNDSTSRADDLLLLFKQEQQFYKHISAACFEAQGQTSGSNK
jgi:hypothetical protein